jgi:hypothetical protein
MLASSRKLTLAYVVLGLSSGSVGVISQLKDKLHIWKEICVSAEMALVGFHQFCVHNGTSLFPVVHYF